jgi:hypothetical protein
VNVVSGKWISVPNLSDSELEEIGKKYKPIVTDEDIKTLNRALCHVKAKKKTACSRAIWDFFGKDYTSLTWSDWDSTEKDGALQLVHDLGWKSSPGETNFLTFAAKYHNQGHTNKRGGPNKNPLPEGEEEIVFENAAAKRITISNPSPKSNI